MYIFKYNFIIEKGKILNGTFDIRNAIESIVLSLAIGIPVFHLPLSLTARIIILCMTALPAAMVALIGIGIPDTLSRAEKPASDQVIAYVDGSYRSDTGEFSYGMVILKDGEEHTFCEKMTDKELALMHNVAGEIKGSEAAMQYAVDHNIPEITIYHDYEGIAKWCTGAWKATKPGTIAYQAFYREAVKKVKVHFVKVKGHSNDKYNDMADQLAKKALGIL